MSVGPVGDGDETADEVDVVELDQPALRIADGNAIGAMLNTDVAEAHKIAVAIRRTGLDRDPGDESGDHAVLDQDI